MIETPTLTDSPEQATACISLVVPRSEIQSVMGPAIGEVYAVLKAQGVAPAGPWLTHHRRRPTDTFDFDVCVPVARPVEPAGRVRPGTLPAARVARTVYRGNYDGLAGAWGEFCAWIDASGHTPREDLWERYLVGPETSPNPADWTTELNRPLVSTRAAPGSVGNPGAALRTERVLSASPRGVFAAFERPDHLARWWGPAGFTNTFGTFEFAPGGRWAFTMHGPDGTDYRNENVFRVIEPDCRVVIEHVSAPRFTLTVTLAARGDRTHLAWVQEFETAEVAERLRAVCEPANEQNLDRLQALLAGEKS